MRARTATLTTRGIRVLSFSSSRTRIRSHHRWPRTPPGGATSPREPSDTRRSTARRTPPRRIFMTIFRLAFRVRETHILISETHKLIICYLRVCEISKPGDDAFNYFRKYFRKYDTFEGNTKATMLSSAHEAEEGSSEPRRSTQKSGIRSYGHCVTTPSRTPVHVSPNLL